MNLSDPGVVFNFKDGLGPKLDVSVADYGNNDCDFTTQPPAISRNAIIAQRMR